MHLSHSIALSMAFCGLLVGCSSDPRSRFITRIEEDLNAAKTQIGKEYEVQSARVASFDAVFTGVDETPYEGDATFEIVSKANLVTEDYSGPCRVKMVYTANYLYGKEGWEMTDYRFANESYDAVEASDAVKATVHQLLDGNINKPFEASNWPEYESAPELENK